MKGLQRAWRSPVVKATAAVTALALVSVPAAYVGTLAAAATPEVPEPEPTDEFVLPPEDEPPPPRPWAALAEQLVEAGRFDPPTAELVLSEIWAAAEAAGRDPWLDVGVVVAESDFEAEATSVAGARGLYQLMPETAAWLAEELGMADFHPDALYEPLVNIRLGSYYLTKLYSKYQDWDRVLTAYNRGEGGLQAYVVARGTARSHYSERVLELQRALPTTFEAPAAP